MLGPVLRSGQHWLEDFAMAYHLSRAGSSDIKERQGIVDVANREWWLSAGEASKSEALLVSSGRFRHGLPSEQGGGATSRKDKESLTVVDVASENGGCVWEQKDG
jgi:hypothetical protein